MRPRCPQARVSTGSWLSFFTQRTYLPWLSQPEPWASGVSPSLAAARTGTASPSRSPLHPGRCSLNSGVKCFDFPGTRSRSFP